MTKHETQRKPVATLTLIVDFDEFPTDDDLAGVVEEARGFGTLRQASLQSYEPIVRDLR